MVADIPPGILVTIWIAHPGSLGGSCRTLAGGEHDLGDPFGAALGDQDLRAADDLISRHDRITTKEPWSW
jgi:hypothetical protein